MNNPPRLLQSCSHPEARALLRAGMAEGPQPSAMRATALALGVGAGISVAGVANAAVAAKALAAPSVALVVGKWVAIGTLAGIALAGGANVITSHVAAPPSAPPLVETKPQPAPAAVPPVALPTQNNVANPQPANEAPAATPRLPSAKPLVAPTVAADPPVESTLPSSASLPSGRDLAREVALIDAARQAVVAGNASAALKYLDQYTALDRSATLDREAQLLRIDALLLSGSKAQALRLAQGYLALHPGDPHSTRLRALVQAQ